MEGVLVKNEYSKYTFIFTVTSGLEFVAVGEVKEKLNPTFVYQDRKELPGKIIIGFDTFHVVLRSKAVEVIMSGKYD
jgi:hypothetical protein